MPTRTFRSTVRMGLGRLLLLSVVSLLATGAANAARTEVDFPCRQIWTADAQRILGARAEPVDMGPKNCVIKIGDKFPIGIFTDPGKQFQSWLAKARKDPKTRKVTKLPLGDEGYLVDQRPAYTFIFRKGNTTYHVLVTSLIKTSPVQRLALAKAVARKASGAPNPIVS